MSSRAITKATLDGPSTTVTGTGYPQSSLSSSPRSVVAAAPSVVAAAAPSVVAAAAVSDAKALDAPLAHSIT